MHRIALKAFHISFLKVYVTHVPNRKTIRYDIKTKASLQVI